MAEDLLSFADTQISRGLIESLKERDKRLRQIAHDVRSPLSALKVALGFLHGLPEEERLIVRSAVTRIEDIANTLLSSPEKPAPIGTEREWLLAGLVELLITEKRIQYRTRLDLEIHALTGTASYGLFSKVNPVEFKRVLSNLINNAVEASPSGGTVEVVLHSNEKDCLIDIRDRGIGVSPDLIKRLGRRGVTYGKPGGSGLGLHHAQESVASWGGELTINSETGKGTIVTLHLPKVSPPKWFVPEIRVPRQGGRIVVLDDDPSIHQIWKKRFAAHPTEMIHFTTAEEFSSWARKNRISERPDDVFLVDFELGGQSMNGIQIIESLGIVGRSILVTSRYEEEDIRAACERRAIGLIPKNMAGFVPTLASAGNNPDAILLDDDSLVHLSWKTVAERKGKLLHTYFSPAELISRLGEYETSTPIFVDSHLEDGIRGEEILEKLHSEGFGNIYLATGDAPNRFGCLPCVRGIVGKEPPWLAS